MINKARAMAALMLTAIFVITSCSSSSPVSSNAATTPSSSGASQSTAPDSRRFTSSTYGYAVTLPAGWTSTQALVKWDGRSQLDYEFPQVDLFIRTGSTAGAWAVAARWKRDLAAYARFLTIWNVRFHACPPKPETRSSITIGGQPGVLLAYNCGILINMAATVHGGIGYVFLFRDPGVAAATDPTDRATFLKILRSVQLPD
jgi:hypothetical protein